MSFDLDSMRAAVARYGRVARVVVAEVKGSAPREVGAAMLVWAEDSDGGQSGTIGGGALEFEAAKRARTALASGDRLDKVPLGPGLGQCCGGAVMLLTEVWDAARLARQLPDKADIVARPLPQDRRGEALATAMPLAVKRRIAMARNGSARLAAGIVHGWMVEPVSAPAQNLWVWGAGHVGRAIVGMMATLPGWRITWVDTAAGRYPDALPDGVVQRIAANPAALVPEAPRDALHLVMTYSHPLDLELCHALLAHGFAWAGLIGSDTKAARFRSRLRHLGHPDTEIARIRCPIGRKSFGKHPQAIAVGVAADLLSHQGRDVAAKDATG